MRIGDAGNSNMPQLRNLKPTHSGASLTRLAGSASLAALMLASSCASTPNFLSGRRTRPQSGLAKTQDHLPGRPEISAAAGSPGATQDQAEPLRPTAKAAGDRAVQHAVVGQEHLKGTIQPLSHETVEANPSLPATDRTAQAESGRAWAPDIETPARRPLNDAAIAAAAFPDCPRIDLPTHSGVGSPWTQPCAAAPCLQEDGSDEYVCDGGDGGLPVHYESGRMAGLEVEDTVAEFVDSTGERKVLASNRVCVYSPRFGVARAVTEALEGLQVDRATGTHDGVTVAGYINRLPIDEAIETKGPGKIQTRDRLSGLSGGQVDGVVAQDAIPALHSKLVNAFQDYGFLQKDQIDAAHREGVMALVVAANEWSDGPAPRIIAQDLAGQQVESSALAAEYVGIEDRRGPGELRLVKIADKQSAKLGETVKFTIRFDNLGGRELLAVKIIDHLSPRLELIEDSIACDVPAAHEVVDGEGTGRILQVHLDESLQGGTGGVLTFECRVR